MRILKPIFVLFSTAILCSCTTYDSDRADAINSNIERQKEDLAGKDILGAKPDRRNLPDWRR